MKPALCLFAAASAFALATPALAAPGDPVIVSDDLTIDPMIDGRLRYETVSQDNAVGNADALTMRIRAGAEFKMHNLSLLAEAEGTLAIVDDYNDTIPGNGLEPYSVVADPDNVELNRLQLQYKAKGGTFTFGRQRIILDNARFVGNVGWRQNEQTFDAMRGQAKIGPVALDATYAISQRTIFGVDSPNRHFDGNLILLNGGVDTKVFNVKGFAYLIDYDTRAAFSSQTYGGLATGDIPLGGKFKLNVMASYAHQTDYGANPVDYSANYIAAELGASIAGFGIKAGYEELGSDNGVAAFQTPLATLHAFNGWADMFLTTPATGLRDYYAGVSKKFDGVPVVKGISAAVVYHQFDSDFGGIDYGSEWDASLGFKWGPVGWMVKYANYNASAFGVDTEKLWVQAEFKF
ncbi:MAG: alginate export family protein [Novosphingobium sp.]|nr:alginate export family protein [Novosphingobium sp.]